MMVLEQRVCEQCRALYLPKARNQKFCSERCKATNKARRHGVQSMSEIMYRVGDRVGRLTLIEKAPPDEHGHGQWFADCECGTKHYLIRSDKFGDGRIKSCGCLKVEIEERHKAEREKKAQQLEIQRQVNLQAQIRKDEKVRQRLLESQEKQKQLSTRLLQEHPELRFTFNSWQSARTRCVNPNNRAWKDYGGRGITMCDYWIDSFENFLKQMGSRPVGMTLDRKDPNGNYELANCRWATPQTQSTNTRPRKRNHERALQAAEERAVREFLRSVAWG